MTDRKTPAGDPQWQEVGRGEWVCGAEDLRVRVLRTDGTDDDPGNAEFAYILERKATWMRVESETETTPMWPNQFRTTWEPIDTRVGMIGLVRATAIAEDVLASAVAALKDFS